MSEELKPCPFCNGEAQRTESSGLVSCAFEECPAFLLAVPADNWNRRAQPAEAEGVEVVAWLNTATEAVTVHPVQVMDWDDESEPVEPLVRQSDHLAALSAVTAERDRLREDRDSQQRVCIAEMEKVSQLRAEVEALRPDAERLDRLDIECEAYGCEGIHEGNRWMLDGPFRTVRDAIDAMAAKEA